MRWRERGAWWRTLLGLIIAIVVLLVVHVSLLVAGPPPVAHGAWMVLTAILLLVGFGGWFAVAIPWVLGFWPAAGEVTRQAGALQARIAAAQRSAPPSG